MGPTKHSLLSPTSSTSHSLQVAQGQSDVPRLLAHDRGTHRLTRYAREARKARRNARSRYVLFGQFDREAMACAWYGTSVPAHWGRWESFVRAAACSAVLVRCRVEGD